MFQIVVLAIWVGLFGLPGAAVAQLPVSPRHIGVLLVVFSSESKEADEFREGLRDAGYVEGRDVVRADDVIRRHCRPTKQST